MLKLIRSIVVTGTPLVVACVALGCSSKSNFDDTVLDQDTGTPPSDADTGGPVFDVSNEGGDTDLVFKGLEIDPGNAVLTIDLSTTPVTPATQTYKITLHADDGSTKDVSATAKLSLDDAVGTFTGPAFTSVTALPGGKAGMTTVVRAIDGTNSGAANLTIVMLRKGGPGTDGKKDFFFVVPYMGPPTPTRDVLKFGTNIKQVDVAFVTDTTGSMGGSITNLQTSMTTTIIPNLIKAIPSVGIAVVDQKDYPITPYGGTTDFPVKVHQIVTTDATKAKTAVGLYAASGGYDGPESQIPGMQHTLTGEELKWTGGSVPKHVPAAGTFGAVDFRPGSLPVVVETTDVDWHGEGHTPYDVTVLGATPPTMATLKAAFIANNAKFVDITNGAFSASEDQANELSDATKSNLPPAALGGTCPTGLSGAARPATGPGGTCRLNFLHNNGSGVSDSIVKAIQGISVGSTFDVTAKPSNDPTNAVNPDTGSVVDATQFILALRAMDEGDAANGCPAHAAKDTDGDTYKDTFISVVVGTPVCFEVLPKMNTTVKPKSVAQFFNAFIDVLGMPGSVKLDNRTVLFLVPPTLAVPK